MKNKISCIVAAYNEGPRLGSVLEILTSYNGFDEVIVVNDGSTDTTSEIMSHYAIKEIHHIHNKGKGQALQAGIREVQGDVIFLCDADITGLTHQYIDQILEPVLQGKVSMGVAIRDHLLLRIPGMVRLSAWISGERAFDISLWNKIPEHFQTGFKIELALNFFSIHHGDGMRGILCKNLHHTSKEKKYGVWKGFRKKLHMYKELATTINELYKDQVVSTIWPSPIERRRVVAPD